MYVNYLAPVTDQKKTCGVGGHPTRSGVNIIVALAKAATQHPSFLGAVPYIRCFCRGIAHLCLLTPLSMQKP